MKTGRRSDAFVVLSSRRAFEAFTGPVPAALRDRYVFLKPRRSVRVLAALAQARLVISQSYFRPEINRFVFAARRRGVPTLLLVDGPLEWTNVHTNPGRTRAGAEAARALHQPIVHDAVATIGPAQTRFIGNRNAGRGITYLSYANRRIRTSATATAASDSATASAPAPGASSDPRIGSRFPPEFDFLLTTARTAAFDARERADLERALVACARALASGGYRILVRIFDEGLREAVRAVVPGARFEVSTPFVDALRACRCVIGTPSSVLLEAMIHRRPTAILVFRDAPLLHPTGWLIGGFADWQATFASMLARDPARMALQDEVLRENVAEQDFFEALEAVVASGGLAVPRPLDDLDLAFENRVLHGLLGWRARLLAPILGLRSESRPGRPSSPRTP